MNADRLNEILDLLNDPLDYAGQTAGLLKVAALDLLSALDAAEQQAAEDARKVEAYDAARATVKREGKTRAEYVLRAEAAEARATKATNALKQIAEPMPETEGDWGATYNWEENSKRRRDIARAVLADLAAEETT